MEEQLVKGDDSFLVVALLCFEDDLARGRRGVGFRLHVGGLVWFLTLAEGGEIRREK